MTRNDMENDQDRYEPTLGLDAIHEILKSDRRRMTIRILQLSPPLQTDDLIDAVTRREYGPEYSDKQRKRIRVSLHQAHLSKLVEHRVVVERGDHYELGPTAGVIIEVLDCSEQVAGIPDDNHDNGPGESNQYSSVTGWMEKIGLN